MNALSMQSIVAADRTRKPRRKDDDGGFPVVPVLGTVASVALAATAIKAPGLIRGMRQAKAADALVLQQRRTLAQTDPAYPEVVLGGNGLEAAADAKLAPHFIRREDVPAFLADSQVKNTAHHGATNERTYYGILLDGARVDKNKRSVHGKGFYTAMQPGGWGDRSFEVAVKVRNAFVKEGGAVRPADSDATIVRWPGYPNWVIAHSDDQVKFVVDLPGQAPGRPTNAPVEWDAPAAGTP